MDRLYPFFFLKSDCRYFTPNSFCAASPISFNLAAFFNSCATLFTEDFYKPMKKGMSESHYVMVGRIASRCRTVGIGLDAYHDEHG